MRRARKRRRESIVAGVDCASAVHTCGSGGGDGGGGGAARASAGIRTWCAVTTSPPSLEQLHAGNQLKARRARCSATCCGGRACHGGVIMGRGRRALPARYGGHLVDGWATPVQAVAICADVLVGAVHAYGANVTDACIRRCSHGRHGSRATRVFVRLGGARDIAVHRRIHQPEERIACVVCGRRGCRRAITRRQAGHGGWRRHRAHRAASTSTLATLRSTCSPAGSPSSNSIPRLRIGSRRHAKKARGGSNRGGGLVISIRDRGGDGSRSWRRAAGTGGHRVAKAASAALSGGCRRRAACLG